MNDTPTSSPSREALIASMTEDLAPVSRVSPWEGGALIAFATALAAIVSVIIFGFWTGIFGGQASGFFWITNGLLMLLGVASASALLALALPRVGSRSDAPIWSSAMLGVLPVAAIIMLLSADHSHGDAAAIADPALWYWDCAFYGTAAGLFVALAAIVFLRRGAPVTLNRAGWITGLAAGALGSLAYGITCPIDSIAHVGIVHVAPVFISAILGRLVVPHLIRW